MLPVCTRAAVAITSLPLKFEFWTPFRKTQKGNERTREMQNQGPHPRETGASTDSAWIALSEPRDLFRGIRVKVN